MWHKPSFQVYYAEVERIVRELLDKESPTYLLQVDPEQYLDYLVSKVSWQPLAWDEGQKTIERVATKGQRYDIFDEKTYSVDVQRFRLRISIAPHPQLREYLELRPSTTHLGGEPKWTFQDNQLVLEVDPTEEAVRKGLEEIHFWLGGRNRDIEIGNRNLNGRVRAVWEAKRRQLEEQRGGAEAVLQKLNIPLYQDTNAKARPIEIKPRQLRTVMEKPSPKRQQGPELRREDILALVDFIDQYIRQFEVAPRTYTKLDEEELRDLIVSMLNVNYPGSTTAETFNKLGKTDIHLRVDEGNVLIAECKVWRGLKEYGEAIEQLFGYLTWRESYGILIVFSKRKDMISAVTQAKVTTQKHVSFTADTLVECSPTRFSTRHQHPQDPGRSVEVFHLFIDLSV